MEVWVAVGVELAVDVIVGDIVAVGENVVVAVEIGVAVDVDVNSKLGVPVAVAVCDTVAGGNVLITVAVVRVLEVGVRVTGIYTTVLVALMVAMDVFVTDGTTVSVVENVGVWAGKGVRVINDTPGVRKSLIQLGCVRIEASIGSMCPLGRRVRKALFGSR
jgi:hypothetical protein